jgi:hypothetical protein
MKEEVLVLEYPNGRQHTCTTTTEQELSAGTQFEMFGHVWRVSRIETARRGPASRRLVCVSVSALGITPAKTASDSTDAPVPS